MSESTPDRSRVPAPVVRRLSIYLRELEELAAEGRLTVSSGQLGHALGFTGAQVRKDLAHFGQFGQPGVGYGIQRLIGDIRRILGTDRIWRLCLVGVGNLGRALLAHAPFARKGFQIVAAFDSSPDVVGQAVHGHKILHVNQLGRVVKDLGIEMAISAVPAGSAQEVCDALQKAGISGILNLAPKRLEVDGGVSVISVDLAVQLEQLAFHASALLAPGSDRR